VYNVRECDLLAQTAARCVCDLVLYNVEPQSTQVKVYTMAEVDVDLFLLMY